ncbi:uncharacterized protein LOC100897448 [Galendromus occidentalis]|uniref:Uncharacterized protein LOC100897448 n=1 Tax=Galendromus occidentalis TaxID=34638 RepID=A0AAJ6QTK7_9ACAR|nr:uncharacterized protein LOC100897448 [Galendromus occidentalis]
MGDISEIHLDHNTFGRIAEKGLDFHSKAGMRSFSVLNNRFSCDCYHNWLWRYGADDSGSASQYESFLHSSKCDAPSYFAGLRLSEVVPLIVRDKCIRIEPIHKGECCGIGGESPVVFVSSGASGGFLRTVLMAFLPVLVSLIS